MPRTEQALAAPARREAVAGDAAYDLVDLPFERRQLGRELLALAAGGGSAAAASGDARARVLEHLRDVPAEGFAAFAAAVRSACSALPAPCHVLAVSRVVAAFAEVVPAALPASAAAFLAEDDRSGRQGHELGPVTMVARLPEAEALPLLEAYRRVLAAFARDEGHSTGAMVAPCLRRMAPSERADFAALCEGAVSWVGATDHNLQTHLIGLMFQLGDAPASHRSGLLADLGRLCPPAHAGTLSPRQRFELLQALAEIPADRRAGCVASCQAAAVVPRPHILRALSYVPASRTHGLMDAFAQLPLPPGVGTHDEVHVFAMLSWAEPDDRARLAGAAQQLAGGRPWQHGADLRAALASAAEVAPTDWDAFVALVAPLVQLDRWALVEAVAQTPPGARAEHQAVLLAALDPAGTPAGNENVMDESWQAAVDRSLATLRARFAAQPAATEHLEEVVSVVRGLAEGSAADLPAAFARTRAGAGAGAREIDSALRTLVGARQPGDYSEAIAQTPARARDLSLVWHAIADYRAGDGAASTAQAQANMRHGVVMALAQSIEDDGHRVCGVGQRHRLVGVLQGYDDDVQIDAQAVTVGQLLGALGAAFDATWRAAAEPSPAMVAAFRRDALAQAADRFGADSPEHARFADELDAFVTLQQYDAGG